MAQPKIQGEYVFRRQEMVSAFNFTEDGKFQFFYSYGAADRNASGSFTIEGDTLKLKSDKAPGRDFIIEQQSKSGSGYQIICKAPNPHLFLPWKVWFLLAIKSYLLNQIKMEW